MRKLGFIFLAIMAIGAIGSLGDIFIPEETRKQARAEYAAKSEVKAAARKEEKDARRRDKKISQRTWKADDLMAVSYLEREVRKKFKDPESVRFDHSSAYIRYHGLSPALCGTVVNAQNGFGGYTGRKRAIITSGAILFEDHDDWNAAVSQIC